MPRKPNNATSVTDLIYDELLKLSRWGAPHDVERISDTVLMMQFHDNTATVQIKVSRKDDKK